MPGLNEGARLGRKEFCPPELGHFIRNATTSYHGHDAVWGRLEMEVFYGLRKITKS